MPQTFLNEMLQALAEDIGLAVPTITDGKTVLHINEQYDVHIIQRPNHAEFALFSTVKTLHDTELAHGLRLLMAGGAAAQSGVITPAFLKTEQQAVLRSRLRSTDLDYADFRAWLLRFFDALVSWHERLSAPSEPEDTTDNLFLMSHALAC